MQFTAHVQLYIKKDRRAGIVWTDDRTCRINRRVNRFRNRPKQVARTIKEPGK